MIDLPNFLKLCNHLYTKGDLSIYPSHSTLLTFSVNQMRMTDPKDIVALDYLLLTDEEMRNIALNKYYQHVCIQMLKEI